jgi:glutamate--cysteine ligase
MSYIDTLSLFQSDHHNNLLRKGLWGLEKESLRITATGNLALTPHPPAFGDKIKNPVITTDFSESQIEMVTPPCNSILKAFLTLAKIQNYVNGRLNSEYLWPLSMPANLPAESEIPIAQFDHSKRGIEAELYRRGLALRYGKKMQMISGIHYNFSFHPDFWDFLYHQLRPEKDKQSFINDSYFSLARNYIRYRWLLIYLFGASPMADKSFSINADEFEQMQKDTDSAVSLRMSPVGYSSFQQKGIRVSFDNLDAYIHDLQRALQTESYDYQSLGVCRNGKRIQLNSRILQKDSEFYSSIRFKADARKGESHINRLTTTGVRYIEIRSIDLNPFLKFSLSLEQLYFYHLFLLYCLFDDSNPLFQTEMDFVQKNDQLVTLSGRSTNIKLFHHDGRRDLIEWANSLLTRILPLAELLDRDSHSKNYLNSSLAQKEKLKNPFLLPSWKIVNEMRAKRENHIEFGIRIARQMMKGVQHGQRLSEHGIVYPNPDSRGAGSKYLCRNNRSQ